MPGSQVSVDGTSVLDEASFRPDSFCAWSICLPRAALATTRRIEVVADNPRLAIEQFDAQPAGRVIYGFGEGWNEQEYNPRTGVSWRWTTDRAVLRVRAEGSGLALTLRGEIEEASTSHVVVRAGEREVAAVRRGANLLEDRADSERRCLPIARRP